MRRYSEAEIRAMIRDEFNAMYNPKNGPGLPQPLGLVPSGGIWTVKLDQGPSIEDLLKQVRLHKVEKIEQNTNLNTENSIEEVLREACECSAEEMERQFEDQIDVLLTQLASEDVPEAYKGPIRQTLEGLVALLKVSGRPDLVRRIKTAMMTTQLSDFEQTITEGSEALKRVLDRFAGKQQESPSALESFKQELIEAKFSDEEIETIIDVIETDHDNIVSLSVSVIDSAELLTVITTRWGSEEEVVLSGAFCVVEAKTTEGKCDTNVFGRYNRALNAKVQLFKLNRERNELLESI